MGRCELWRYGAKVLWRFGGTLTMRSGRALLPAPQPKAPPVCHTALYWRWRTASSAPWTPEAPELGWNRSEWPCAPG